MVKVEVLPATPEARRFNKANKVLGEYLSTAGLDDLQEMAILVSCPQISLKNRKKAIAERKKTILALKPLFKQHVIELNKVAEKDGYKNRIDYMNERNGVPKEKFKLFLEKADEVIKILNRKFPELPLEWADWYWSKYSIPDAPCLATQKKYVIPDDIIKMIKKKAPEVAALLPKIKIQKLKDFYSSARYDKKKKKVIISTPLWRTSVCGAFTFIHEISHAVVMLNYAKKGIDTSSKSKYWGEREAYKVESKLVKKLFSKKVYGAWLASFLDQISSALFEYEIYTRPERNFDRVFARVINHCYLKARQHENPFYVLYSCFVLRSGNSAMSAVAITELLLENKI